MQAGALIQGHAREGEQGRGRLAEEPAAAGRTPDRNHGPASRRGIRTRARSREVEGRAMVPAFSGCRFRPSSGGPPARSGCTPGKAVCRSPVLDGTRAKLGREGASATPPSVRYTPRIVEAPASRNRANGTCTPPDGRPFRSISDPSVVSPSSPSSPVRFLPGEWPAPELQSSARPWCLRKMAAPRARSRASAVARGRDLPVGSGFGPPVRSRPGPSPPPACLAMRRSQLFDMIRAPK